MKRLVWGIAVAVALGVTPVSSAHAVADGPDYYRVVGVAADDVLNIRAEPSARSAKIGTIPHDGNGIRNRGCEGGLSIDDFAKATEAQREAGRKTRWCQIEYRGVIGWVAGWYLGEGSEP